jgi:hypothetical protein
VRGVALQGRGWLHRTNSDRDGAPAGLSSWFDPAEQRKQGSRVRPVPLRGRGALAVLKWAAQCRGADTGLVAQSSTVVGMGSHQGVGGTALGRDSQARDGATLPCQSIKCSYPRTRAGALVREPSSEAEPARGGREPSSEAESARGCAWALERGGTCSRGRLGPRARRNPLEGALGWASLAGHGGHHSVGRAVRACLG